MGMERTRAANGVMLCSTARSLPVGAWVFEPKWDGFRAQARITPDGLRVRSRNGSDFTDRLPELGSGVRDLAIGTVLDGELIVCGDDGRPDFHRLSSRMLGRSSDAPRDTVAFVVFDVLNDGDRDVRDLQYRHRRALLHELPLHGCWQRTPAVPHGNELWASVVERDLEGIVAKRADSPYRPGRSRDWVKVKNRRRETFVVGGWGEDDNGAVARLHVGQPRADGALDYRGTVEIGIGPRTGVALREILEPLRTASSPFAVPWRGPRWVAPTFSVDVSYGPAPASGFLREAALLRPAPR